MALIAFVYADLRKDLSQIYRPLCEGLVVNIHDYLPGNRILHVTDDETPSFNGCNTLRVKRKVLPMSWRLIAQNLAHATDDEILFLEPDVRLRSSKILEIFKEPFDVTVCDRETPTTLKGRVMGGITLGMNLSRSFDFWKDCAKECLKLDRKNQLWGGDMIAVEKVVESGKYKVLTLPAPIYNHVPLGPDEKTDARVVHYKGKRKTWLFNSMAEV